MLAQMDVNEKFPPNTSWALFIYLNYYNFWPKEKQNLQKLDLCIVTTQG